MDPKLPTRRTGEGTNEELREIPSVGKMGQGPRTGINHLDASPIVGFLIGLLRLLSHRRTLRKHKITAVSSSWFPRIMVTAGSPVGGTVSPDYACPNHSRNPL